MPLVEVWQVVCGMKVNERFIVVSHYVYLKLLVQHIER